jgi:ceramide kinase
VDGVLVVGGDGTFNEVLNGLMSRPEWGRLAASRLRFGVIPAGSTDAVACTLHGTRCPRTAAAHAALGGAQPMDALRLDAADGTMRWASNFAGYGFYGDGAFHTRDSALMR